MLYPLTKSLALRLIKAPTAPPDPPAGDHASVQIYRASPRFLTYRLLGFWIFAGVSLLAALILAAVALAANEPPLWVLTLVTLSMLAVGLFAYYFSVRIDYDMRYYVVTDRSVRVRQGAFIVKEMTITFANIQNMRAVQGPLLRFFGIKHLQIDTAGGGGSEAHGHGGANLHRVRMAGIDNADVVRSFIQDHLKTRGHTAGLGDPDDELDTPTVAAPGVVGALRDLKQATAALRRAVS